MRKIQYFNSAWGDIKNSPGWFGKLCLLALINFIPIFGQIVTFGYLYGWAREIAWGTHEPMPAHIFGNEDGKLYRRGWFVLVLVFVAALIPTIVMNIGSGLSGTGLWGVAADSHAAASSILTGVGLLIYLIGLVGSLFLCVLAWIGSMRISIYDRLSAGFQIGKIWKMLRNDTGGILRIFGMNLLVSLIIGIVLSIVFSILLFLTVLAGVAGFAASGYSVNALQHMSDVQAMAVFAQIMGSAGFVGLLSLLIVCFLSFLAETFIMALVARAMGYWTMQFDVPHWRGQDDPMPFESAAPVAGVPPVSPVAAAPVAQQPRSPYPQPVQPTTNQNPYNPYNQTTQPVAQQPYGQATQPVVQQPYSQGQQVVQPTQPVQQPYAQGQQPAQPLQPEQLVESVQPAESVQPVQPAEPVQPVTSIQPDQQPSYDTPVAETLAPAEPAPTEPASAEPALDAPPVIEDAGADQSLQEE